MNRLTLTGRLTEYAADLERQVAAKDSGLDRELRE